MSQVLDHLWQSTLLALGLAILALAFRKTSAAVRHGLWLSASLKFLVPFAALAALARLLGPAIPIPVEAKPEAVFIAEAARPFSQPALSPLPTLSFARGPEPQSPIQTAVAQPPIHADAAARPAPAAPRLDLGLILLALWALGSAAVLARWVVRWSRLHRVLRSARPLDWPAPMPVLAAPSLVEPGLVGLRRPVLLVPETLPERLSEAEIDALLAHEACHLRRRDNLASALHMLVEALFWFHPLVWWIGARLIDERERACDEAVVRAGHERAAYARSLVEICRFYLQSPLDCVAGASGSSLKTRVEAIMTAPPTSPLSRSKKALLLAAGVCALATPVAAGLLTTPQGQRAVARAAAIASRATPAFIAPAESQAPATASDESPAAKPVVLAQNAPVLAPGLEIARLDAAAPPLARDVVPPSTDQAQSPARPGTEDAVRRWILSLQTHQPDLDLSPALEQSPRPQIGLAEQMFRSFGGLKAVRFVTVTAEGDDAYEADFTHAKIQVQVGPLVDGKLTRLAWGPLWTDASAQRTDPAKPAPPINGMQAPLYRWGDAAPDVVPAAPTTTSAAPSRLALTPVATDPNDARQAVSTFVQSYGEPFWNTDRRLCIRARGLPSEQARMVEARVAADARAVGVSIGRAECSLRYDIEIRFDRDADRAVREVLNFYRNPVWPLPMDRPQGANRPIRAWYGMVYDFAGGTGRRGLGANPSARTKFALAIVVVDPDRTKDLNLDLVSDYVAKLGLSQPRALDKCNALPSVTDLFAGTCPGRRAPTGLTTADTAFLTALYTGSPGIRATRSQPELVDLMTRLLGRGGSAAVDPPGPAVQPAIAATAPPRLAPTPISLKTAPGNTSQKTSAFVRSYAFLTQGGPRGVARWRGAVRLHVTGLSAEQNAAVEARVRAVAKAVGAPGTGLGPPGNTWNTDVAIVFAADPQRVLDDIVVHRPYLLGDQSGVKSITRPVQAWYQTDDQTQDKRFGSIVVIVDLRRTEGAKLGLLADYVAMMALSEPRTADICQPLPSLTDLFAGPCPDGATPQGLTPADDAYLTALYGAASIYGAVYPEEISARMAKILAAPSDPTLRKTSDIIIGNSKIRRTAREMGAVDR